MRSSYDDTRQYIDINHIAAIANSRGISLFRVDDPPQIAIIPQNRLFSISLGVVIGCVHHKNSRDKSKTCPKRPVRKDFLERLVIDTTLDVALYKENIQSIAADLCTWQQRQKDIAILDGLKSCRGECEKAISNLVAALEAGAASPTIAARVRDREEELESIKYAIAKQELVQEKFDEKKIMYFISKVPEGDRADINYMQRIVNTFINSVFVYEDRVVICHNFDGDEARSPLKKHKFHMPSSY